MSNKALDVVEVTGKAIISTLPNPLSTLIIALYDKTKENKLNKRQQQWEKDVEKQLQSLNARVDELINSETFVTALIKTTELAIKVGSDDKRQYLANALKNSYLYNFDEERFLILMSLVEKYTVTHFRVIQFLHNPKSHRSFPSLVNMTVIAGLGYYLHKYNYEREYLEKIVVDLKNDSVIVNYLNERKADINTVGKLTTKLGDDLLKLVLEENQNER